MLYEMTTTEVINSIVNRVKDAHPELSNKKAKMLALNALIYNCVVDEICGQVDFLLENEVEV